jgi:lipoprotein signal peptidase
MDIGSIVAGILTLAILSFLYKDNPIYKAAESLLIGVSIGYILVITWTNTLIALLFQPLFTGGQLSLAIPFVLGLLMLGRFHQKTSSLSRIPIAVMIGSGAGVAIPAMLYARTLKQMSASVYPILTETGDLNISGIVVIIGLICSLLYFYFSREHKGIFGKAAGAGTYFLMIFFGTTFGYTVMSRMSTLIGRMEFLLTDFFHLTN